MENKSILTVDHVNKSYGSKTVLTDINLEINQPEIFGLVGPSGAGKTTLIKMIAGMEVPSKGQISVFGEKKPSLKLMESIGYMAQSDALYGELTAIENLRFFAQLFGLKGNHLKNRINEALDIVDLKKDAKVTVNRFSGGMKRRLSLAIALVHRPKLLILDEPTVGIDPELRKKLWDYFHQFNIEGITIIVTTHVMDEAERCHRLGMIRDGKLIAQGTPAELKEETGVTTMEDAFLAYGGLTHAH